MDVESHLGQSSAECALPPYVMAIAARFPVGAANFGEILVIAAGTVI